MGIELVGYLPEKTWFAAVTPEAAGKLSGLSDLRAAGKILPKDKVRPEVWAGEFSVFADNGDGTVNLFAELFKGVDEEEVKVKLSELGAFDIRPGQFPRTLDITIDKSKIENLARIDGISWIEGKLPPPTPTNDVTRSNTQVNTLQATPYSLDGSGLQVGIFEAFGSGPSGDGAAVDAHQDFASRQIGRASCRERV